MKKIERDVRAHLADLRISESLREDVICEIAAHLELAAEEVAPSGISEIDREKQILAEVSDWNQLKKGIQRYKGNVMRDRLRRLWLPAMMTGVLAYAAQMVIYRLIGPGSHIVGTTWVYSWQWLLILFATGAFGAYLSRRFGGSLFERILVALAPAEAMGAAMAVGLPIGFTLEIINDHRVPYAMYHPGILLASIAMVVLLPAVPSILGASVFLFGNGDSQKSSATS